MSTEPTREELLRRELAMIRAQDLSEAPSDPAVELLQTQFDRRAVEVQGELDDIVNRRLVLRLSPTAESSSSNAVRTNVLASLLSRLQQGLDWAVWALSAGPGVEGAIPASITRAASTEVVALSPGSVEVSLRRSEVDMTDTLEKSIDALLTIAEAGLMEEGFDEGVEDLTMSLGPKATRRLELFFKKLGQEEIQTRFSWLGDEGRSVDLDPKTARLVGNWLGATEPRTTSREVTAELVRADTKTGEFALERGEQRWEGRAAPPQLLYDLRLNEEYRATLTVVEITAIHTEGVRERVTLTSITAVT